MLSLGSNISATQVVESKYSASFDGTGDFIELGESDNIISTSQANVTLMCWVKPQEEAINQYIFTNKRVSGSSNFSLRIHTDIKFNALIYTGSSLGSTLTSTTTITAGTWYHVAITAKANEQKIYINGLLEHTVTLGFGMAPSATDECTIGSFGSGNEYEGLISELAIFNACLTGEAVLAAYNSGFDLKTNVGDYTNSSDITHYYKMGNGLFDDKASGIIHDQVHPGFDDNLVTNGHFDVDTSGWLEGNSRYIHSLTWEKDCLYFFSVDLYLVSGKFRMDGADTAVIGAGTGSTANIIGVETYDAAIDDRWRTVTGYAIGVATGNTDELWIRSSGTSSGKSITQGTFGGRSGVAKFVFTGTGEFYIDNVSVRKLTGLGSELAPSSLSIDNGSGGGTITQVSGNSYSSTSDGNNSSVIRPKFDFNTESGKTYKLVITPTGSITGTVHFDFNDGSSYLFRDYDFTTTKEIYFTDNGTVFGAFNGQQVYSISGFTISVKELEGKPGLTSGDVTFLSDNP